MFRKLGVALATLTVAVGVTLVAAPDVSHAGDPVGAILATPASADTDGDGLVTSRATVALRPDGRSLELPADHGHSTTARTWATVATPGHPRSLILEHLPVDSHLALRTRADGRWSAWSELVASGDDAPDGENVATTTGIGPIWLGHGVDMIELAALDRALAALDVIALYPTPAPRRSRAFEGSVVRQPATTRSAAAATTTTTSTTTTTTTTTAPAGGSDPSTDSDPSETGAPPEGADPEETTPEAKEPAIEPDGTFIHPRAAWATEAMEWNCDKGPRHADGVEAIIVHHTAGRNEYTAPDVPDIIRSIWYYHVQTRGWCDIAYNLVVDMFGGVWEARQGGIGNPIIGGHARGFNTGTVGIAQLGNYDTVETPELLADTTARIVAWKAGIHGVDPAGVATLTNRSGGEVHGVPDDGDLEIAAISGHRDVGSTSCPGQHSYDTLVATRTAAATGVHVLALQRRFLRDGGSPGSFAQWLDVATEEDIGAAALGMARSAAYSGRIIDDLYQRVLGRAAEADGKAYWLETLESGVRIEDVGVVFYGSKEYVDAQGDAEGFVRALYENLLHRSPDDDGLRFWVRTLQGDFATPPEVASGFYESIESRRDRVLRLYDDFLGRTPDANGHEYWSEQLLTTDDVLLAVHLSLSPEFYERAFS